MEHSKFKLSEADLQQFELLTAVFERVEEHLLVQDSAPRVFSS
ncbi:hypothetical protein QVA66_08565 [Staphylococcus chromogenes]|nr:hypothetical protein [Staphylococcus chromogenes]